MELNIFPYDKTCINHKYTPNEICTWCFIIPIWCILIFFFFRSDSEITGYALDALCNVLSNEPLDDGKKSIFHHIYVFVCTVHVLFNRSNVK